jgi:hypothetical protein
MALLGTLPALRHFACYVLVYLWCTLTLGSITASMEWSYRICTHYDNNARFSSEEDREGTVLIHETAVNSGQLVQALGLNSCACTGGD